MTAEYADTLGLDTSVVSVATALSISTGTAASASITSLTALLTTVSTGQSNLNAYSVSLAADQSAVTSLGTNLQSTINSLQAVDQTALQAQLQQFNNQQSVDYYLVSQMNTAAKAVLSIFR
jgi:flagellin-like hook-associated protein FlgL